MRVSEIINGEGQINEARIVWAREGNKVVRKFRCTSGRRKGRLVKNPSTCNAPVDVAKSLSMKKAQSRAGPRMRRRAVRTKSLSPSSKMVSRMNRARTRRRR